jgi:hypothetical protein
MAKLLIASRANSQYDPNNDPKQFGRAGGIDAFYR